MKPKFSICIPVYNRQDYLVQAIRSCLAQTEQDFEIVVSDDCSTVALAPLVDRFGDARVRYSRSDERLGASRNHQRAVAMAEGELVLVLHSDDLLIANCLELAGAALDESATAAAVYFSCTYLTPQGIEGCQLTPKLPFADEETLSAEPWLEKFHGVGPSCCLFRRAVFESLGGYRTSLRFAYDWELYMRFLKRGGGVIFLPRVLTVYRVHDEQAIAQLTFAGLQDILDLWKTEEYAHWPAWEVADLVLRQASISVRRGESAAAVAVEVWKRGLGVRTLSGTPEALLRRVLRRLGAKDRESDLPVRAPDEVDSALKYARDMCLAPGGGAAS